MTKKLTPVQRMILKDLYDNILSFAKKHLNPKNQIVYRIYERSNKPIRNVNPKIFEYLMMKFTKFLTDLSFRMFLLLLGRF